MYGIIYKATNKQNNKVYIGQTQQSLEDRIYNHKYRAYNELDTHTHFMNAIRKYGIENFIWEIIDTAKSLEELNNKEFYWIKYYNSVNNGYNTLPGGEQKIDSEKFAIACGSKPFYAFKVNGEFLGEFINKKSFARQYGIVDTHIKDVINKKYNSYCGYIFIDKKDFSKQELDERLKKAKQSFRPFKAKNLKTQEEFGPFESMQQCREFLKLKNNHIGEVLKGKRKSQDGYTFYFID